MSPRPTNATVTGSRRIARRTWFGVEPSAAHIMPGRAAGFFGNVCSCSDAVEFDERVWSRGSGCGARRVHRSPGFPRTEVNSQGTLHRRWRDELGRTDAAAAEGGEVVRKSPCPSP